MPGPLDGVRVLELGSIGPGPFAAMMLADMGAEVLRVERLGSPEMLPAQLDPTRRGRAGTVTADLKHEAGRALVLELAAAADILIEGFRPGVLERLGLDPDLLHERNPRLVVGRMTGYGQEGPLADVAGHDINYISLSGALGASARAGERPMFALNLVGDYGGGAMFLAFGVVCALLEARASGRGQVVDAAMVDGSALLTALIHGMRAAGAWSDVPGTNLLDSGAPFYEVYRTKDGGHVAVGALEPQFYARLLELLDLDPAAMPQWEVARWPEYRERFTQLFATRTRDDWAGLLEHEDACLTPVMGLGEAAAHPHIAARGTFIELDGVLQPAPAPRFSRTPGAAHQSREQGRDVLRSWAIDAALLGRAEAAGAIKAGEL